MNNKMEMQTEQTSVQTSDYVVYVNNVTKGYQKNSAPIINQLNTAVPKGSIYSLLGPSGCGKTTLLRCILGVIEVDNGVIEVAGSTQEKGHTQLLGRNAGYMPQDVALAEELTISETFLYYGSIVGMNRKQIKSRAKYLVKFLHLPSLGRFVGQLSGGQKRRVSFAVAILHEPSLLILDEPTVGVDPPLRHKMWGYLSSMARDNNTSIIITTHYIEEARSSQIVGMMMHGKLLAEAPPEQLINHYNKTTLEDVFLHLCLLSHDGESEVSEASEDPSTDLTVANHSEEVRENGNFTVVYSDVNSNKGTTKSYTSGPGFCRLQYCLKPPSLHRLFAIVMKNIAQIYHHPGALIYQIILPVVIMTCVCLALGRDLRDLNLGIINEDRDFASELFLESLPSQSIRQIYFSNYSSAYEAVQNGEAWGIVQIKPNFTNNVLSRFLHGVDADKSTLENSHIDVTMDMSNSIIENALVFQMYIGFQSAMKKALDRIGVNGLLGDVPIMFREPVYGNDEISFLDFTAPGVALSVIFFLTMDATSLSLLIERKLGQMERSIVAGVTPTEIILGNMMAEIIILIIQAVSITLLLLGVFGLHCSGSMIVFALIIVGQGLGGISYGMLISALCNHEYVAVMSTLATVLPTLLLSGVVWPLDGMPPFFQKSAYILPTTLPAQALRGIMGHGWSLTNATVVAAIGILSSWFIIFLFLSIVLFHRRQ